MGIGLSSLEKKLQRFNEKAESAIIALGGFLILLFLAGVVLDVASRIYGYSISWMQEITTFIFVWTVFLGSSVIYKKGALYTINILPKRTPKVILRILEILVIVANAFCISILLYYGYELSAMGIGRVSQPSGIRIVYAFASIPVAAAFMTLFTLEIVMRFNAGPAGRNA
jgi:TRAP-type C4-dicarboxylate transport system permease small subunit